MTEFKVEVLKYPTDEDWQWVKKLALNTMGKDYLMDKEMSVDLKKKYLTSEHSPIRYLRFIIRMEIPYCNSVHFVRHKLGVEHFVQSQRNDRQDNYDRKEAPQDSPVSHIMVVNAQELMFMARKRLCGKADIDTQKIMRAIVREVLKTNPEFNDVLVPQCQYLHACPEFVSCGRWITPDSSMEGVLDLRGLYEPTCFARLDAYDISRIEDKVKEATDVANLKTFGPDATWGHRATCMLECFLDISRWLNADSDVEILDSDVTLQGPNNTQLYITATCMNNKKTVSMEVASLGLLYDKDNGGVNWIINSDLTLFTAENCVKLMRRFLGSLPWKPLK